MSDTTDPLVHRVDPKAGTRVPSTQQGQAEPERPREIGGRKDGTEPTRFGDWEKNGRCIDF